MKALDMTTVSIGNAPDVIERLDALATYYDGWAQGCAETIGTAVAEDYVWDDPRHGRVMKDGLGAFLPGFKDSIDGLRRDHGSPPYHTLSDWVVDRGRSVTTVWCSFAVPGTDIEGMSQIRVGDKGVISEHRAYQTRSQIRMAGRR